MVLLATHQKLGNFQQAQRTSCNKHE